MIIMYCYYCTLHTLIHHYTVAGCSVNDNILHEQWYSELREFYHNFGNWFGEIETASRVSNNLAQLFIELFIHTVFCVWCMPTDDNMRKVDKYIVKRSHNLWFEAKMILSGQKEAKKVYCYISPKVNFTV